MKKVIVTLVMLAAAVCSYAQTGLKGTWNQSQSLFGISASDIMTFQDDKEGKVIENMKMTINANMLGVRISGEGAGCLEGTFKYEGDKITVHWNADSFKFDMTKPITLTVKNEDSMSDEKKAELEKMKKEMAEDWEKEFATFKNDMIKKMADDDVYTDVKVNAKKLTYKYIEDGKTETDKYTRVK